MRLNSLKEKNMIYNNKNKYLNRKPSNFISNPIIVKWLRNKYNEDNL